MEAVVQKAFQRQLPSGAIREHFPGDRIQVNSSETVHELFERGFLSFPVTNERRKSLEMCMDVNMFTLLQEIQKVGHFKTTPEVLEIEAEVHRIYLDVLAGLKKFADYRAVAEKWKVAGTRH